MLTRAIKSVKAANLGGAHPPPAGRCAAQHAMRQACMWTLLTCRTSFFAFNGAESEMGIWVPHATRPPMQDAGMRWQAR